MKSITGPRSGLSSQSSSQQASLPFERRQRERRLYESSLSGSVESLAQLLQEDRLILARTSVTCFDETPLHVACMLGHVQFAKALLAHKQDLTMELDSQGRTPLHLVSANGYVEIARELLRSDIDACLVLDEERRTPLHLAVMKGRTDVVRELVKARPEAATCGLSHGQTVLHQGARHNRLETMKVLVEMVRDGNLVNAQDDEGNTILHLATANKQIETVKYLLQRSEVDVNRVNRNGFSALNIVEQFPKDFKVIELRELLEHAGAVRAITFPGSTTHQATFDNTIEENSTIVVDLAPVAPLSSRTPPTKAEPKKEDNHEKWIREKCNSLMITATVIAAMAYQAGLSPPGGVWNENIRHKNGTIIHLAGTSIMAANFPYAYEWFWIYNTVSFVASLSTIFLLISGLPLKKKILMWILMATMWVTITCMSFTYGVSMWAISNPLDWHKPIARVVAYSVLVWYGVLGSVFLVHIVRILQIVLRIVKKPQKLKKQIYGFLSWCKSRSCIKI